MFQFVWFKMHFDNFSKAYFLSSLDLVINSCKCSNFILCEKYILLVLIFFIKYIYYAFNTSCLVLPMNNVTSIFTMSCFKIITHSIFSLLWSHGMENGEGVWQNVQTHFELDISGFGSWVCHLQFVILSNVSHFPLSFGFLHYKISVTMVTWQYYFENEN